MEPTTLKTIAALCLAIVTSSLLIFVVRWFGFAGRPLIDALVGGVITTLLILSYPFAAQTPAWAWLLVWLTIGLFCHNTPRIQPTAGNSAASYRSAGRHGMTDIEALSDLFEFEEVASWDEQ